jgi:hypothetical protein
MLTTGNTKEEQNGDDRPPHATREQRIDEDGPGGGVNIKYLIKGIQES